MNNDKKQDILKSRVYDIAIKTPLERAQKISSLLDTSVYLKREDLQKVHSFKLRGAINKISQLKKEELSRGVITASAGNHAQGVAISASKLNISALVIMPKTTPLIKINAVKSYGAEVELFGDNYSEAAEYCKTRALKTNRVFIHPFDDPLVIEGQGTIGQEIIEQLPEVTHIFVPVGGGGLISGIAKVIKSHNPKIKIIGVQPEDSNAMQLSIRKGKRIKLDHVGIFADGVAVKQVGNLCFKLSLKYVDEIITVTNDQICAAIKLIFEETRGIVEPAGALAVAGINKYHLVHNKAGSHVVAINSGANITFERLQFIAERTLLGSEKEAIFAITIPEKKGSLKYFCETILKDHNITQFGYRLRDREMATILLGISVKDINDKSNFINKLKSSSYDFNDLGKEDIAIEHIRHMIGGVASNATNEHFYQISFPERPGALMEFLNKISNKWNISLFHYRGQGGDIGSVFIGFESDNIFDLEQDLKKSKYIWERVDGSVAISKFISKK